MKSILVLLLLVSSVCIGRPDYCEPLIPGQRQTPKIREYWITQDPSIVHIRTECGMCSGFVVKEGVILTAAHCFDEPVKHIRAEFIGGKTSNMTIAFKGDRFMQPDNDVAVLTGDTFGTVPFPIALTAPNTLNPCAGDGYGMEGIQKAFSCYGSRRDKDGLDIYVGEADFGDSGGPIVNEKAEVIGLLVAIGETKGHQGLIFAVPSQMLFTFLKRAGL